MLSKPVTEFIPNGKLYGFDSLMLDLLKVNKKIIAKKFEGYWLDIGRPDDYLQAIEEFENMKSKFIHE